MAHPVDIWIVRLVGTLETQAACAALLSRDEREQGARFRRNDLQMKFFLSHGTLRLLLGYYTGISPREIQFGKGAADKPFLLIPNNFTSEPVQFNMSHSGDFALYGFTNASCIGVDVEEVRDIPDMDDIAQRFFSSLECEDLISVPLSERRKAFFRCWTRKEAFLKATGDGLAVPLDRFRVEFREGRVPALLQIPPDCPIQEWQVENIDVENGYAGSVVYSGVPQPMRLHRIHDPMSLFWIGSQ